jgi:hypothetical protein
MPTFTTPNPIDLAIKLPVGSLEVFASDRTDTVVTVTPSDPSKAVDRRGAEETKVEFDGARLTITGPKPRFSIVGPYESIEVKVELPTGSRLTGELSVGGVRTVGRLGATRVKASSGAADLDATGNLWLRVGHGNAVVDAIDGGVEITADHGQIRIGGDLETKLSYGDLDIGKALGSVTAKTAYGSVQVREVSSGSIQLESGFGEVTVGVREGVAAWLDLSSKQGRVRNQLDGDTAPSADDSTVAIRARTEFGYVNIRRAV